MTVDRLKIALLAGKKVTIEWQDFARSHGSPAARNDPAIRRCGLGPIDKPAAERLRKRFGLVTGSAGPWCGCEAECSLQWGSEYVDFVQGCG